MGYYLLFLKLNSDFIHEIGSIGALLQIMLYIV